ncbi:Uu.00g125420.m01.CDS01 [Anthostomella pinea]|uniref:Uu.00g125420.m01.CDS01 n=1 Tax=Anthostomella pinea TaxID=933095 RepID=A0AAI8VHT1_9PEZI|nr:Uu.00g125420.m01.CDS01 [Anthostomella pinea]
MAWGLSKGALSGWGLLRWLALIRLFQALASLVTATMNGFLLAYIHLNRLGFANSMFVLEIMACVALIYPGVVLLILHTGKRRQNASSRMIATFVVTDVILSGLMLAIITLLARTGVPSNCHGLTRDNFVRGDAPDDPPPGYTTIRFGDGPHDGKGLLDRYCTLERGFYFISITLVFTYTTTITLGILRICERYYTRNSQIDHLLTTAYNIHRLAHKQSELHRPTSPADLEDPGALTAGILAPMSRGSRATPSQGLVSPSTTYHSLHVQPRHAPLLVSPVSPVSPMCPGTTPNRSFAATPTVFGTSTDGLMAGRQSPDPAAEAAVTDGYRHQPQAGMSSLPPYSPGPSRAQFMTGHGNEANDLRLSDYVKGENRAQHMKDSGAGL